MKTRDLFALAIRLVGLYFVYQTVQTLGVVFTIGSHGAGPVLFHLLLQIAGSFWFLVGAPPLMNLAYPEAEPPRAFQPPPPPKLASPPPPITFDGAPCVACGLPMPPGAKQCPKCGWTQPISNDQ